MKGRVASPFLTTVFFLQLANYGPGMPSGESVKKLPMESHIRRISDPHFRKGRNPNCYTILLHNFAIQTGVKGWVVWVFSRFLLARIVRSLNLAPLFCLLMCSGEFCPTPPGGTGDLIIFLFFFVLDPGR